MRLHVHPIAVQGHFLLSAVLVANAAVLHHRAARPDGDDGRPAPTAPLVDATTARLTGVAVAGAALVMLAGTLVTGSGPHAGDETAERLDLSVRGVAMVHSALTWLFLAVVVLLAVRVRRAAAPSAVVDRVQVLLTVVVLQGAIGYVQYATGVPELLVGLHVLGSMVVWVAAIRLRLTAVEPVPTPAPDRSPERSAPAAGTRLSTSS